MTTSIKKPLILIDGSSYLHRAFHALPPLITSKGEPTGAVYGVINMIRKLLNDYHPEYMAVVFDAKGKTFRHELFTQYKAHRPPMEEDLKVQIKPLHEIIKAMGLPLVMVEGVEADDVIGTLTREATKKHMPVLISTGDKDMAQLVNENVMLINTMTNTTMNEDGVKQKFGVRAEQMIDYLALIGDTSDNIPGVSGVGPKTAAKWLDEYHSLDNLIKHASQIKGKIGEKLLASIDHLALSKKLVTIKDDVKLDCQLEDLKPADPDNEKLREIFTHLEFKNWLQQLAPQISKTASTTDSKYYTILTAEQFAAFFEKLLHAHQFAFNLETTSPDMIQAEIVGLSIALKSNEAFYIPIAHVYKDAPKQLDRDFVFSKLKSIFENPKQIKLGQNLKYNMNVLANYDISLQGLGFDIMLESYVLNSSSNQHDNETLALRYLGKTIAAREDLIGKGAKRIPLEHVPIEKAAPYAAQDSDLVLQLHEVLWPQIKHESSLERVFQEIEMPLVSVLSHMEREGVCVDKELLHYQSKEITKRLHAIENQVCKEAGEVFNLNSPQQLQEILFTKLKLPVLHKTPAGQPSTAEAVLQELSLEYDFPKLILEHRSLSKIKSTYTDSLPEQIDPKTGRVHTSYNQAVTATGRLSSTNPNLQNIPIRTDEGRKIRQAFIAPQGRKIISADYSQIELRIMAHLSHDKNLLAAFAKDDDIHRATAAEVFDVPLQEVTSTQRRDAKMINFGLIYGMSAFGLAKRLGMAREKAQKYIELYFARYPGVKTYMEKMRKLAHSQGFVETLCGRRLYIPEIHSKNFVRRSAAERAAINAPMQGTAADLMKIAMIDIDHWIASSSLDIKMIMQVHDELVFEVAARDVDHAKSEIKKRMEKAAKLNLPVIVHAGVGDNWDEAH